MYVNAIEEVAKFTRPIHTITRTFGGLVSPGTSTLFFVNENGVAITCKHVAELLIQSDPINVNFNSFKAERNAIPQDGRFRGKLRGLETKYKYSRDTTVQVKNSFVNCVDGFTGVQWHLHPTLDLAILIFQGHNATQYTSHAIFVNDPNKLMQGRNLCRLGFPFPEFNNFQYNPNSDDIEWTNQGNPNSPRFPIDGIITRFAGDPAGVVTEIELSTPGLRGQSGGPLFDTDGLVYGMQSTTMHLHLGFDIRDKEVVSDGKKAKVSNYPFLHVGRCVHVDRIKDFLRQHNIQFYEQP